VIGAIIRDHLDLLDEPQLALRLRHYQRSTLLDIAACGTEACGLHRERCDHCGDQRVVANTCGNRSCPHCQAGERRAWVEDREAELLPCGYFHAVLTLPAELRGIAEAFPHAVYGALMRAAPDAIQYLAAKPEHLDAEVGSVAVLHTWGRDLKLHPHVHLIVTAGGWQKKRQCWIDAPRQGSQRRPFLVPVAALRATFQLRLARLLLDDYDAGAFQQGDWEAFPMLGSAASFRSFLSGLREKAWCIHIEPPFGSPQVLLRYLGRYINRVAVSPQRVQYDTITDRVTVSWKDHTTQIDRALTLEPRDFMARFARHILPPGFVRIRFRGLWCTAHRTTKLDLARRVLETTRPLVSTSGESAVTTATPPAAPVSDRYRCTACGIGIYRRIPGGNRPPRSERHRRLRALRQESLATPGAAAPTA
jgi:hypothetical protein